MRTQLIKTSRWIAPGLLFFVAASAHATFPQRAAAPAHDSVPASVEGPVQPDAAPQPAKAPSHSAHIDSQLRYQLGDLGYGVFDPTYLMPCGIMLVVLCCCVARRN